ncbi:MULTISPECIES: amidohydrolase [unclassified Pyramidobacter]|uniref:amidohydrolase n=1 Tax=unclassified Pyramidobacter TaxID=2632171 RepID=UPI000EA123BB|nr:amidohydrolase [Pyramidobacter sp. CG50-2]RKJ77359.1 amidohydrolase [Pyramidobacter sp. CG50-2]
MKSLVIRGKIWTGCKDRPWAEATAVENGRFVYVGDWAGARAACPGADVEDYGANMVMPGMSDGHLHLTAFARQRLYVDLLSVKSLAEAGEMLRKKAAQLKPGAWIRAINFNEMAWADTTPPTREWLDSFNFDHPVVMSRYCGHRHIANTRAMKESGLWNSADPYVLRDERGEVTGVMTEGGAAPIIEAVAAEYETPQKLTDAMEEAALCMASRGVTCGHACDAPKYALGEEIFTWQNLYERGKLPVRVICYHDRLPEFTFRSGIGNDQIMYGGLKIFMDGTLGGHTCAMREPFDDMPGSRGVPNHTDEELDRLIRAAHRRGIQVQAHMIGDAAVEQAAGAVERVIGEEGRPRLPYRFVHVICCPKDLRERLARLGVVLDLQPCQCYTDRVMAPLRLGAQRALDAYPFRALWDTGLLVVGSTDAPMELENMWIGIWSAVCRCDDDGSPLKYDPSQTLTLDEALTAYTINPWRAVGRGNEFGRIHPGYRADFTVTDGNPFEKPAMELRRTTHLATYLEGRKVWSR